MEIVSTIVIFIHDVLRSALFLGNILKHLLRYLKDIFYNLEYSRSSKNSLLHKYQAKVKNVYILYMLPWCVTMFLLYGGKRQFRFAQRDECVDKRGMNHACASLDIQSQRSRKSVFWKYPVSISFDCIDIYHKSFRG